MTNSYEPLVDRIIEANAQIPAKGCRAQHAKHGGHHKATFTVHALDGELKRLEQGIFQSGAAYPAIIRYSNGKEQSAEEADVHGLAIKLFVDGGDRLLEDPDDRRAVDFILIDVDTFFSDDLGDYAIVNEHLVPLLQRKQKDADRFSFWEALGSLLGAALQLRAVDDVFRLFRFRGEKEPVGAIKRWDLDYSSATPFKLGAAGPVKYRVRPAAEDAAGGVVSVEFCVEVPRKGQAVDVEAPSKSWAEVADVIPVATLRIEIAGDAPSDVERLRFNPWHVPEAHEPLGAINFARRRVYDSLADKRQKEMAG